MRVLTIVALLATTAGWVPPVTAAQITDSAPVPVAASSPVPVDSAKLAVARQIIAVAYPAGYGARLFGPVMQQMMARFRAGMPLPPGFDDPGLHKMLDDFLVSMPQRMQPVMERNFPLLLDAIAHAYAREFSRDELNSILAFAGTPAGHHYFTRSSDMMGDPDVGNAMTAMVRDSQGISRQAATAFQQQIKDYLIKHPDVAGKLRAASEAVKASPPAH